jgi:hypothetical protein
MAEAMSGYVLKPADAPVEFVMDWRRGYLAPGEKVLRDLGWSVQPAGREGAGLAVVEQAHDAARSWARFAGGAPGGSTWSRTGSKPRTTAC